MSETLDSNRTKIFSLAFVAAATTVISGLIHVLMGTFSEPGEEGQALFFLIGGVLQIFWALPVIKGWDKLWQYVGIGGTALLIILWLVTHIHGLSHGRGLGGMTLVLETSQIAFIGLCIVLLNIRSRVRDL